MDMRLFTLPLKSGHRWTMSVSIAHHGDISTFDQTTFAAWNEVADNFLQATQHGSLHVKIDYDHDGLLDAILEGRILEKVATEGRLLLRRYNPIYDNDDQEEDHSDFNGMKAVTKDEILSTPLNRVVGDCTIELTPIERFWLLTHKVTEEECLEALIRKRESRAEQEAKEKEEERQKEEGWKAWQEVMQELLRKAEAKAEEEELGKVYPSGGEAQAESANSGDRSDVTMVDAKQSEHSDEDQVVQSNKFLFPQRPLTLASMTKRAACLRYRNPARALSVCSNRSPTIALLARKLRPYGSCYRKHLRPISRTRSWTRNVENPRQIFYWAKGSKTRAVTLC